MLLSIVVILTLIEIILGGLILAIKNVKFTTIASWLIYGLVIIIVALTITSFFFPKTQQQQTPDTNFTENTAEVELETESISGKVYTTTLSAGHYTVGIDIPSGIYSFYVKSGFGNLISADGEINEIFDSDTAAGEYISDITTDKLNNISLSDGNMISVLGTLEISAGCEQAGETFPRNQNLTETELGYGIFAAGDDFPAGTYSIVWIEGYGNVISDSHNPDYGINEIFGAKQGDEGSLSNQLFDMICDGDNNIPPEYIENFDDINDIMFITEFKNVTFEENDLLKIENLKVKLIPSE